MSTEPFLPLQTPADLRSGVEVKYDESEDARYFQLPGRGSSSVPPWILTTQHAIPRGTASVLVRFRCKSDLGFPSGASNQGICVRMLVITRDGNGTSEDPRIMYDSSPEDTTSDTVWYRESHGDIREVTRVLQMPESVIGGSHIVIQIYTRGTGGSADIYGPIEIRNHYSRTYKWNFGAFQSNDTNGDHDQYAENFATPLLGGRLQRLWMKQFTQYSATIPRGRPISVSTHMHCNDVVVQHPSTGASSEFIFGIGLRLKRRDDGDDDWIGVAAAYTGSGVDRLERITDRPLEAAQTIIAERHYTSVRAAWFFLSFAQTDQFDCKVDMERFKLAVVIDDSIESS